MRTLLQLWVTVALTLFAYQMSHGQCFTGTQFPSSTQTPTCSGVPNNYTGSWTNEYTTVDVMSGTEYTFTVSVTGYFITIANATGTSAFTSGTGTVVWTSTVTGPVRFYSHVDNSCPTTTGFATDHTRSVTCAGGPPPPTCPGGLGAGTVNIASLPYNATGLTNCGNGNNITSTNATVCGSTFYYNGEDKTFIFTPTVSGSYDIVFTTASTWSGLMLYAGCPFIGSGGTCVAQAQSSSGNKTLTVSLTAGVTYYLVVDSFGPPNCHPSFALSIAASPPPPANNDCSGAIAFPTIPSNGNCVNLTVTTVSATGTLDATCTGAEDDDVWYTFTTPAGATTIQYVNTSISGNTDRVHQIYSGSSCGTLTHISCHDPETGSFTGLMGNTTYFLRTYTFGTGVSTTYDLCLRVPPPPPVNDECAGAITIPTIPSNGDCVNVTVTTVGATGTLDATCSGAEDDDVWHRFTTPAGATVIQYVNTSTSGNTDRMHQLYSGSTCGTLTHISCHDPETGSFTGLTGNTTYFLRTYTFGTGVTTTFNLCLRVPPPPPINDNCASATSLPVILGSTCSNPTSGTTANATQSLAACAGTANDDVWYSFVATNTFHDVTVVGATGFDAVLNVRTGACNGTSLVCVDNNGSGGTEVANLTGLTIGTTYLIRVHHWSSLISSNPTFTICVTTPLPPCSAPSTPMVSSVGTTSATLSWGAVSGATLYRYSSGTGFHTCGSGSLTTANNSVVLSGLTANTTYTFCVRTDACGGGAASSYVSTTFTTNPLPNDNCSGAISVSCNQTVTGTTAGATSDAAMGSCSLGSFGNPGSGTAVGGTPGRGVWYRLTGDGSQVTASLCNSSYDTKIHIYAGACGTLTCVASNDDNSAQCSPGSRSFVQFNTNPGTDYYILVSGFSSSTGNFSLQIGCVCGAPLGAPWTTTAVGGASGEAIDNVCGGSIDISSNGFSTATSDKMMFSSQQVCGDGSITVRVANITNQGYAGITMRENMSPGSRNASLSTQLANRVFREARTVTNGQAQKQQLFRPAHSWLRIVRSGDTFTFFSSSTGSQWGFVGTTTIAMPNCIEVGMYTTGITQTSTATAVFTDVDMTGNQSIFNNDGNTAQFKAEIPLNDELSVFPNPSSGEINLRLGQDWIGQPMEITIFNSVGKVVMNENIDQINFDTHSMSLDGVASGIYFIQVKGENGLSKTERIVINK